MKKMVKVLMIAMMLAIPTVITFNATTQTVEAYSSGWHKDGKGWWYATSNRSWHANRWAKINNKWYHFKANGYMTTGWLKAGNKWYYLHGGNNGSMATGWLQLGGKWYYLNGGDDGSMATGWVKWNNQWYYLRGGNDGSMVTNAWVKTGGKEYYLEGSGAMATNKWVKDWYVGNDGAWIPNTAWGKEPKPNVTTPTPTQKPADPNAGKTWYDEQKEWVVTKEAGSREVPHTSYHNICYCGEKFTGTHRAHASQYELDSGHHGFRGDVPETTYVTESWDEEGYWKVTRKAGWY